MQAIDVTHPSAKASLHGCLRWELTDCWTWQACMFERLCILCIHVIATLLPACVLEET